DSPPTLRTLGVVLMGEVRLGAEHRLEPVGVALLVEVEDAVHVPVVGDAERGLTVGGGRGDEVGHPRGSVEHRVLGVDVEVGEGIAHAAYLPVACSSFALSTVSCTARLQAVDE